jgi:hypothetical protein
MNSQTKRILEYLLARANQDVPSIELHRAGSGKELGFCASLSRRISDIRARGYTVILSRDERENGQRWTCYRLILL